MYMLRRTVFRVASTSTGIFAKPRSISATAPAIAKLQQHWTKSLIQRRLYSNGLFTDATPKSAIESVENETPASEPELESSPNEVNSIQGEEKGPKYSETGLYVGNIHFSSSEEDLIKAFSVFGPLAECRILYDSSGYSRGFGFLEFERPEDAVAALNGMNSSVFQGRRLAIHPRKLDPAEAPRRAHRPTKTHTLLPTNSLFIGNIAYQMSDKDLNDLFREIRNVLDVRVSIDRKTGRPRGFAHADFIDVDSAIQAREILSNKTVYGRRLRVDYAIPIPSRKDPETPETEVSVS